jgi:hypothetical protein
MFCGKSWDGHFLLEVFLDSYSFQNVSPIVFVILE